MVSGGETPKCSCKNRAPIRSAVSSFQISGRYNVHARGTRASRAEVKEGNDRVESKRGKFLFDSVVSPDRPVSRNSSSFPRHPPLYKRLVPFLIFLLSSYLSLSLSLCLERYLPLYMHIRHTIFVLSVVPVPIPLTFLRIRPSSRVLTVYFDLDLREISRDSLGTGYVWEGISLEPIVIHLWNILGSRSRWNLLDSRSNLATTTETLKIEIASLL